MIDKQSLHLAKNLIFWPTMKNKIKKYIFDCLMCLKYAKSQILEAKIAIPWNRVGVI